MCAPAAAPHPQQLARGARLCVGIGTSVASESKAGREAPFAPTLLALASVAAPLLLTRYDTKARSTRMSHGRPRVLVATLLITMIGGFSPAWPWPRPAVRARSGAPV